MKHSDFYPRYHCLVANWFVFSERIQRDLQTVCNDLHDELARWQPGQRKPDWDAYAKRVNTICRADGYPEFFAGTNR